VLVAESTGAYNILMKTTLLRGLAVVAALAVLLAAKPAQNGGPQAGAKAGRFDHEVSVPLPQECANVDLHRFGRPLLIDEGGMLFGLSMGTQRILSGGQVPVFLWMVNPTDKPRNTMTCHIDWFMRDGVDVVDANGHRALTIKEQKNPEYHRQVATCRFNYECSANMIVTLAPHSCTVSEHPSDLANVFVLGAGQYALVPREISSKCGNRNKASEPAEATGRLVFSIDAQ
jgi:hypothetical protein